MNAHQLPEVDARPRVSGIWSLSIAGAVLVVCILFAAFLPKSTTLGAQVQWTDRAAVLGLGILVCALIAAPAWPRVTADMAGVRTRGFVGGYRTVPWSAVEAVTFPRRRHWASLELLDGDAVPLYAVQRADGERSVAAMAALRELHAAYIASAPGEAS